MAGAGRAEIMAKNPFAQAAQLIQLTIEGEKQVLDVIELVVEEDALAITRQLEAVSPHLVLISTPQHEKKLEKAARHVAKQYDAKVTIRRLELEPIDWVRQVQKDFPPFKLGPFYVYGSHAKDTVPDHALPLLIEAAAAFGTGEHETTACCLLALAKEKQTRAAKRVLDMGCGTAILAIGAARLWKDADITACDNDAVAVEVSQENLAANRVRGRAFRSDGYLDHRVGRDGQYDVIVANILARPLMRLARDAVKHLAPGGTLILSGLLVRQEPMVLSAHRAQGLYLHGRLRRGRWSALVLKKSPSPSSV